MADRIVQKIWRNSFEGYEERESLLPDRVPMICVVDDMSVLKALGRLLCSAGLQTLPFNDSRLFLEHVRSHPIALAIIDIWMPSFARVNRSVPLVIPRRERLADASHKTGRPKAEFEVVEISRERYERVKATIL